MIDAQALRAGALAVVLGGAVGAAFAADIRISPHPLSATHPGGDRVLGIRLRGSLEIGPGRVDDVPLYGLSGLAWDDDEGILYAVSDGGALFHLRPALRDGRLESVAVERAFRLRDAQGRALRGPWSDAEGLDVIDARNGVSGDTRLLVSFERQMRVAEYSPRGELLRAHPLPAALASARAYHTPNRGLESVTLVPGIGMLTAPELPLRSAAPGVVSLYALDGRHWEHTLYPLSNRSLVALEGLPDGSLLALERGYGVLRLSVAIALRRIAPLDPAGSQPDRTETLAVLRSAAGWSIDNFEGLARHQGMSFFMVSDDNNSAIQKTLLVYFDALDAPSPTELQEYEARQESAR